MEILEGKIAVITGGTRGLGLAIARAYLQEGAAVVIASRSQRSVEAALAALTTSGGKVTGLACDVTDLEQVRSLSAHAIRVFGRYHVWVNNAGLSAPYGPTVAIAPEEVERVFKTNIFGVYYGSLIAIRHFLETGSGKLINILGRGDRQPVPLQNAYGSSKTWVRNFTLALAEETRQNGVGVFAFNPGMVDTDMLYDVQAVAGYEDQLRRLPAVMRLFSRPPEGSAQRAVWLASSATDGRTGLEIQQLSRSKALGSVLREGMRGLFRRPSKLADIKITTVPSDLPVNNERNREKV
jgi:glucose 1-dehydrogenase